MSTTITAYQVALAELPSSAHAGDGAADSVVVIDGAANDPWVRAHAALRSGAAALVLTQPRQAPVADLAAVRDAAAGRPVVVDRPRLRADVVADAAHAADRGRPRVITVDCSAVRGRLPDMLRDGLGWARVLAGGPLEVRHAAAEGDTLVAVLRSHDGIAVSLGAFEKSSGGSEGALLSVLGIGETRVEVDLGDPVRGVSLTVTNNEGRLRRPQRWETPERLALRRALVAVREGSKVTDIEELIHDEAVAARLHESATCV